MDGDRVVHVEEFLLASAPRSPLHPAFQTKTALHDNTAAAPPALLLALVVELAAGRAGAVALAVRAHLLVESADLADDVVEGLVDVPARFRRRLDELASELSG